MNFEKLDENFFDSVTKSDASLFVSFFKTFFKTSLLKPFSITAYLISSFVKDLIMAFVPTSADVSMVSLATVFPMFYITSTPAFLHPERIINNKRMYANF